MMTLRRSLDQSDHGGMSPVQTDHQPPSLQAVSRWPGVIGTISIVFAVLGIMCWGCSSGSSILQLVAPELMAEFSQIEYQQETVPSDKMETGEDEPVANTQDPLMSGEEATEEQNAVDFKVTTNTPLSTEHMVLDAISNVVSLGMSIWLLCAGVGLIRRKAWSVPSLVAWSWIRILVAIGWFIVVWLSLDGALNAMVTQMQAQSMKEGQEIPLSMEMMRTIVVITIVAMGLILIAWPVFLLFFLGRQHIRDEAAAWGGGQLPSSEWGGA
ncbi:MAG: hypothetical protein VX527_00520 [Planctomycetota bacterium]|nr:hypothetical protein [Planctomycetota bacterium]